MQRESIQTLIKALNEEIEKNARLSPQDREMLEGLRTELALALSHPDRPLAEGHRLVDKFRAAAERLEASHPDFTTVLVRMMDSLVKMGV